MPSSDVLKIDGSLDFSGGVDSVKTTTIQSAANPNGLARNQLSWLQNGTLRDGGITVRTGWKLIGTIADGSAYYQKGMMYDPDGVTPYLILSIGGHLLKVDCNTAGVADLSTAFGLFNPVTERAFFRQSEQFGIIQAGDGVTLPLFWDGALLRRSHGITGNLAGPNINELPAATAMDYFMGRTWYAQGRQYSAGDIVGNSASGTPAYNFRDSVLKVTENPLAFGGDGFIVPDNAGNIRAIAHSANLNTQLGDGQLYIWTRKAVYALTVPVTRTDWIAATANNQPLQTVVQLVNGSVNDLSIVPVNGDLWYQSLDPGIRSLLTAIRNFQQWGNIDVSAAEYRVLQFSDRSLLHAGSGIQFNSRLLQTALPKQTPQGIVHQAIIPLDFVPMSTLQQSQQPVWQGVWEGLDILQLFEGDFGGRERAFATVRNPSDGSIELWELTNADRQNTNAAGEARTTMSSEFPAFTWGKEFDLKKMICLELWIDKLFGEVEFTLEYRPDSDPCWYTWHQWKTCVARTSCEDMVNPICYPLKEYREGFRSTITLPRPPENCSSLTGRPAYLAYQIQPRLTIKGWCRVRGLLLHGEDYDQKLWHAKPC